MSLTKMRVVGSWAVVSFVRTHPIGNLQSLVSRRGTIVISPMQDLTGRHEVSTPGKRNSAYGKG